jgi:hypothetical protein
MGNRRSADAVELIPVRSNRARKPTGGALEV